MTFCYKRLYAFWNRRHWEELKGHRKRHAMSCCRGEACAGFPRGDVEQQLQSCGKMSAENEIQDTPQGQSRASKRQAVRSMDIRKPLRTVYKHFKIIRMTLPDVPAGSIQSHRS